MKLSKITLFLTLYLIQNIFWSKELSLTNEFTGKIVLITGGTTGIGYSSALEFAKLGALSIIIARDSTPDCYNGSLAQEEINKDKDVISSGGAAVFYKADIRKPDQLNELFNFIESKFGSIDIAVNNAGIGGFNGNIEEIPEDFAFSEHDPILNNLYGVFYCLQREIKHFKKHNKEGVIINLSSYNGIRSCPGCSMYSASKYGIIGLTKSVALENLKNPYIRVNAIAPGLVDTFLTRNQVNNIIYPGKQTWEEQCIKSDSDLWIKYKSDFTKDLLMGRLLDPKEMANIILFLASKNASSITGQVIPGDLGESVK